MPSQTTDVFVSYSHADASLVTPVVRLLRVNKSFVFQDVDHIRPGKKWRSEITKALNEAQLVIVFWCDHASRSNEVLNEWKIAIEQEKDILPLLLDATPLPPELGEFQWIDFRGTVGANHSSIELFAPKPVTSAKSGRRLSFIAGLIAAVVIAVSVFTTLMVKGAPNTNILLLVSVVLITTVCVMWFLRRRSKHGKVIKEATSHLGEIEQLIANKVEVEILRRTTPDEGA